MPKILLVEDDNNLREIFDMRLQAEGYKTVTAGDGEEALVIAVKEKPDLVIADVMMPKLSGFEMVENMRAAPELANVKVIMMTALGQAEDRARGEKLGVVKYLVKSQVTLEDFVRVVREVLPPDQNGSGPALIQPDEAAKPESENINKQESENSMQDDAQTPNNPTPDPASAPAPASDPAANTNPISDTSATDLGSNEPQTTAQEQNDVQSQINDFADGAAPAAPAVDPAAPASDAPATDASAPEGGDMPVSAPPVSEPGTDSNNPAPAGDSAVPSDPAAPAQNTDTTSQNGNAL
jgi:CheY-like chemotaxis protein